jgi:hypothetical protein
MNTLDYEVDEIRIPKWLAAEDARKRNKANEGLYDLQQHRDAEHLYALASKTYASRVYLNYRENFIAVKVETPRISDYRAIVELEKFCDDNAIERVRTKNSVVYRFK